MFVDLLRVIAECPGSQPLSMHELDRGMEEWQQIIDRRGNLWLMPFLTKERCLTPYKPTDWVCEELFLAAGRPTLVSAYSFSGKTLAMQSLALSLATGTPIWGQFSCHKKRVAHIDYEQTQEATIPRYQRMIAAMGLNPDEVWDNLSVSTEPGIHLTSACANSTFHHLAHEHNVVIIDSLRVAAMGLDENASSFRTAIDMLTKISSLTNCTFILVHHAGKGGDKVTDQRHVLRGSSSILDAAGTSFVMQAKKGEPSRVSMIKTAATARGKPIDDFYLSIEDVPIGTNPSGGLAVKFLSAEAAEERANTSEEDPSDRILFIAKQVEQYIRQNPGCTLSFMRSSIKGDRTMFKPAMDWLIAKNRIRKDKGIGRGAPDMLYVTHEIDE
jgi:RecA-family ATPase